MLTVRFLGFFRLIFRYEPCLRVWTVLNRFAHVYVLLCMYVCMYILLYSTVYSFGSDSSSRWSTMLHRFGRVYFVCARCYRHFTLFGLFVLAFVWKNIRLKNAWISHIDLSFAPSIQKDPFIRVSFLCFDDFIQFECALAQQCITIFYPSVSRSYFNIVGMFIRIEWTVCINTCTLAYIQSACNVQLFVRTA